MVMGLSVLAIAGASSIAGVAAYMKPLPDAAPVAHETRVAAAPIALERDVVTARPAEPRTATTSERSRPKESSTNRAPLRPRPTAAAPVVPAAPAEPPKAPRFDSQAAVAGLDAAKAKAEASCRGTTGVRLFVQMGFDADGRNRGAALSDPKLGGTPEAKCTLRIFRAVRIPAFDLATRPSGLGRPVRL